MIKMADDIIEGIVVEECLSCTQRKRRHKLKSRERGRGKMWPIEVLTTGGWKATGEAGRLVDVIEANESCGSEKYSVVVTGNWPGAVRRRTR